MKPYRCRVHGLDAPHYQSGKQRACKLCDRARRSDTRLFGRHAARYEIARHVCKHHGDVDAYVIPHENIKTHELRYELRCIPCARARNRSGRSTPVERRTARVRRRAEVIHAAKSRGPLKVMTLADAANYLGVSRQKLVRTADYAALHPRWDRKTGLTWVDRAAVLERRGHAATPRALSGQERPRSARTAHPATEQRRDRLYAVVHALPTATQEQAAWLAAHASDVDRRLVPLGRRALTAAYRLFDVDARYADAVVALSTKLSCT